MSEPNNFIDLILKAFTKDNDHGQEWQNKDKSIRDSIEEHFNVFKDDIAVIELDGGAKRALFKANLNKFKEDIKNAGFESNAYVLDLVFRQVGVVLVKVAGEDYTNSQFKVFLEELWEDADTKEYMGALFQSSLMNSFFKEYTEIDELDKVFLRVLKPLNNTAKLLEQALKVNGEHKFLHYVLNKSIVTPEQFFEQNDYGHVFKNMPIESANEIFSRLDFKNKKDRNLLKMHLKKWVKIGNVNKEHYARAIEILQQQDLYWNLDEIIKEHYGMAKLGHNTDALVMLYDLVKEQDCRQLLYLINNSFMPGKDNVDIIDRLNSRAEKRELEKMFTPNKMEQFIIEKGLSDKFDEFLAEQEQKQKENNKDLGLDNGLDSSKNSRSINIKKNKI